MMEIIVLIGFLMISVVLHEVSHGWAALYYGDTTAKEAGRLTLNPIKHIDPFGSILLPALLMMARSPFLFAWAKPVPVNPMRMRNPKQSMIVVGASGVVVNFILALFGAVALKWVGPASFFWAKMLTYFIFLNCALGIFNLVPIPPLDGSRVLAGLLPDRYSKALLRLERWGMLIVVGLLMLGFFRNILLPIIVLLAVTLTRWVGAELVLA